MTAATVEQGGLESAVDGGDRRFVYLNSYRALAATAVVATHVGFQTGQVLHGTLGAFLSRLDFGVAIFFLLSGFLLYRPYANAAATGTAAPATLPYLWRRALRILPAYWVAVVAAMLLMPTNAHQPLGEWLRQLLFLQTYSRGHLAAGLTQTWSLCVEVTFYLALPLLAAAARRSRRGAGDDETGLRRELGFLGLLAAVALLWTVFVSTGRVVDSHVATLWLPGFLDWFAVGMALAAVQVHVTRRPEPSTGWWRVLVDLANAPGTCWAIGGLLFWLSTTPLGGPRTLVTATAWEAVLKHELYAAAAFFLLLPGVLHTRRGSTFHRIFANPSLSWLGEVSYALFLFHLVVLRHVFEVLQIPLFTGHVLLIFVATMTASVIVSAASAYLVERPALRLKRLVPARARAPLPTGPRRHREGGERDQAESLSSGT